LIGGLTEPGGGESLTSEGVTNFDTGATTQVVPSGQSAASGVTGESGAGDADVILRVLRGPGNDVVDLGSPRVNGHDVIPFQTFLQIVQAKGEHVTI